MLRLQTLAFLCVAVVASVLVSLPAEAQKPPKPSEKELLARVASYIRGYVPQLINIVAEETFEQERKGNPVLKRRLLSDILLVGFPGRANQWMLFRDVSEVDGQPRADKAERLLDLFVSPSGGSFEQAYRIAVESERFHLPATRSTANPLFMIIVLQETHQHRLSFDVGDEAPEFGPGVRVLHVEEPSMLLMLRNSARKPMEDPLFTVAGGRGRAWVEVATGRVLQTEARLPGLGSRPTMTGTATTTFVQQDRLGLLVPGTMQTTWFDPSTRREVKGLAKYSNYRRFGVSTRHQAATPASVRVALHAGA